MMPVIDGGSPTLRSGVGSVQVSVVLSGTAVESALESEIVAGGKTLIVTLSGGGLSWEATVGADNEITTAVLAGVTSAQSEGTGWNAEVRDNLAYGDLTRDSATQITLVLPASASYSITADESVTWTLPASAIEGHDQPVVASPSLFAVNQGTGFQTPDLVDNESFETGYGDFQNTGEERSQVQAYNGTWSVLDTMSVE